jgi:hypothetical protein
MFMSAAPAAFINRTTLPLQVTELLRRHPSISSLNLSDLSFVDDSMLETVAASLPSLNKLELGYCQISEQQMGIIANRLTTLSELSIRDASFGRFGPVSPPCPLLSFQLQFPSALRIAHDITRWGAVTDESLMSVGRFEQGEVVISHEHLTSLRAEGCRAGRLVVRCHALRSMVLRNSAISVLLPHCPSLTHLNLHACSKISDSGIRSALNRLPGLRHLDLSANLPLSDDTLREVATRCTDLTSLVVSCCIAVSLANVQGFAFLTRLNLSNCESLTPMSALPALDTFTSLEEVIMDSCNQLTKVRPPPSL